MIGRRTFLRALPMFGIGVKVAAENTAAQLAGVSLQGGGMSQFPTGGVSQSPTTCPTAGEIKSALLTNAQLQGEIESLAFEERRVVQRIDPDLAVLRSFSLNAKIAFQRQRDVQRQIKDLTTDWLGVYGRIRKAIIPF